MQPLVWDGDVVRFKQNAIVSHLLDENGTIINVRLTDEQKTTLTEAATRAGLGVSSWLLTLGLREAQKIGK